MRIIEKKCWPKFFREIKRRKKNFEIRLADWRCGPGDVLVLREWDPKTKKFTGREIKRRVSYVLKTKDLKFFSKKDIEKYGFQIIALK